MKIRLKGWEFGEMAIIRGIDDALGGWSIFCGSLKSPPEVAGTSRDSGRKGEKH